MQYKKIWATSLLSGALLMGLAMGASQTVTANTTDQATTKVTKEAGDKTGTWGSVTYTYDQATSTITLAPSAGDEGTLGSSGNSPWKLDDTIRDSLKKIVIKKTVKAPWNSNSLFRNLPNLTEVVGGENLNTENVRDMEYMFADNPKLVNLDVSEWNTGKVAYMMGLFANNESLTSLAVDEWNVSQVYDMDEMFYGNSSLTNLNVQEWDTGNLRSMGGIFMYCTDLTSLDLSKWEPLNVYYMGSAFKGASSLQTLDISSFDTPGEPGAQYEMLAGCNKLWWLKMGENFQLKKDANLPAVPGDNRLIPGNPNYVNSDSNWVALNGGDDHDPKGDTYTSDELMESRPAETETYVWQQRAKSSLVINVKPEVHLTVGDVWNPKDGFISATDIAGQPVSFNDAMVGGDFVDTHRPGTYYVTYTHRGKAATTKVVVSATENPTNPSLPNDNADTGNSDNNGNSDKPGQSNNDSVVYALKKIYLYNQPTFDKQHRIATYAKKPRVNRPMFVVTGTAQSKDGKLRYQVTDVNSHSKTAGMKGYITQNWRYVRPAYYQSTHKTLTVISPNGVNEYKNRDLTGKVKNIKQGTQLTVKGIVKDNLTTRYYLSNGHYITGNRRMVMMGKVKQPKTIKVKKTIYRYKTADLKKNQRISKIKKGTTLSVKKWEYSHPYSHQTSGSKRYVVAGGYVTANKQFVRVVK